MVTANRVVNVKGYDHVCGNVYVRRPRFLLVPDDNTMEIIECGSLEGAKEKLLAFVTLYKKHGAIYQKVEP